MLLKYKKFHFSMTQSFHTKREQAYSHGLAPRRQTKVPFHALNTTGHGGHRIGGPGLPEIYSKIYFTSKMHVAIPPSSL